MARHELWVELADRPGNLAAVASDLAACGANIVQLDVHAGGGGTVVDRLVVQVPDERSAELAAAAARCGATLLHLDEVDPHALVDEVVRALDTAALLVAADRPDALAEALGRLIPADEVRIEARATSAPARSDIRIERAPATPAGGEAPWLLVVPYERGGVEAVAVLRRVGPRFTATEAARCRAALRLAGQAGAAEPAEVTPMPARRPPTTLERLVVLGDGGLVRLRHLTPGDRDALAAHEDRCSLPVAAPTAGGVALAALVGTDIVGVARYDLDPGGVDAAVTLVVEDRHQRRGIGTLLLAELAALATHAAVRRLRAVSLPGDESLARTFHRAGLAPRPRPEGTATILECGLPPSLPASA
jgi:GNAT superfamily N-acetyltransferase